LIVDDEIQSRSLIKKLLSVHLPHLITEEPGDVKTAIQKIQQANPRLVFLDIQMGDETGFDLLDKIGDADFEIVFTTAHSEFALRAFRYSALDYIMKPIDTEEFRSAVEKAVLRINNQQSNAEQLGFLKNAMSWKEIMIVFQKKKRH